MKLTNNCSFNVSNKPSRLYITSTWALGEAELSNHVTVVSNSKVSFPISSIRVKPKLCSTIYDWCHDNRYKSVERSRTSNRIELNIYNIQYSMTGAMKTDWKECRIKFKSDEAVEIRKH